MMLCDFCSQSLPVYAYPCQTFTVPGLPAGSAGGWAACAVCAALIDAGDLDGLADRATRLADRSLLFGHLPLDLPYPEAFGMMRELHRLFFAHRMGEKRPCTLN